MSQIDDLPEDLFKLKIFDQYEYFQNRYQQKYGPNTVVLMQVGGFYELYGVDNDTTKIGLAKEIAILLHIELTRRNKEIRENSRTNHLMAGFPLAALCKYIDILMDNNYTVVVIDQEGTAKDKNKSSDKLPRRVAEIYSPGTYFDDQTEQKYLVQIHLEGYRRRHDLKSTNYQPMLIGISAIDVTTGENDVYEVSNSLSDQNLALDEIYRYLQTHPPKELLLSTNDLHLSQEELESYLDIQTNCQWIRCQINYNQVPKEYYKLSHQQQFLEKIFPAEQRQSMLSVIEYLNLERTPSALISYLSLLQFTYEHNEILVKNLKRPRCWNSQRHLLLANNAITQLDLAVNNAKNGSQRRLSSVINLLDMTSTGMGKRLFRERLLNPILDPTEIENRYRQVDLFIQDNFWNQVEQKLNGVMDLDRLHRRIELGLMTPNSFNLLYSSYLQVSELLDMLPDQLLPTPSIIQQYADFRAEFRAYLNTLSSILDFDEVHRYVDVEKITDNIFKSGYDLELDRISQLIRLSNRYVEVMINKMSRLITGAAGSSVVTLRNTDASGYFLSITSIRYKTLLQELSKNKELKFTVNQKEFIITPETFRILRSTNDKKNHNITCDFLDEISESLSEAVKDLQRRVKEVYIEFQKKLIVQFGGLFDSLSHLLAEVDVYKASAKASVKYHYCRPQVIKSDQNSFIQAINFRHPLVERLNQNSYYVPHSLVLGNKILDSKVDDINSADVPAMNGMLLYGLNSSGKSTCMKAIGVNLVMAQAGMFVPADSFVYAPYRRILTRILGNDNIFKGLSSFAVEMSELRGILARADSQSLVLGDEICHGTETISGVSIVSASILKLSELNTSFIFATHLHQLNEIPEIQQLATSKLGIYHLHVEYDPEQHKLVYHRDLRRGSGNPIYGIEVARAMDLDSDFLSRANQIRQRLMGQDSEILTKKTSRYNSQVFMDNCLVCGGKSVDTHHIKFQSEADSQGFIGSMHKNQAKNLVPLCKPCHRGIDTGELIIKGYLETDQGRVLDYVQKQLNNDQMFNQGEKEKRTLSLKRIKK